MVIPWPIFCKQIPKDIISLDLCLFLASSKSVACTVSVLQKVKNTDSLKKIGDIFFLAARTYCKDLGNTELLTWENLRTNICSEHVESCKNSAGLANMLALFNCHQKKL